MRRCKLISPTNLLLEHPILSPVEECEYYLLGKKEFIRKRREAMISGALVGGFFITGLILILQAIFHR